MSHYGCARGPDRTEKSPACVISALPPAEGATVDRHMGRLWAPETSGAGIPAVFNAPEWQEWSAARPPVEG